MLSALALRTHLPSFPDSVATMPRLAAARRFQWLRKDEITRPAPAPRPSRRSDQRTSLPDAPSIARMAPVCCPADGLGAGGDGCAEEWQLCSAPCDGTGQLI